MRIVEFYKKGFSIRQIAKKVGISPSKTRKILLKNTKLRTSGEGLRLAKQNNYPLNKEIIQRIEGELLGDGSLTKRTHQAKFCFSSCKEDYAVWLSNFFKDSNIPLVNNSIQKERYYHKNWNKWYTRYIFSTHCSIQFEELEKKWYINRKKIIPDLKISPNLVLHWYLGDGSLPNKEYAIFCTDCFSYNEINFLSYKLNKEIQIKSSVMNYKKDYRIFIPKTSVPLLLEYIGKPPFKSLSYKWDLNPIGKINYKIDISKETLYNLYIIQKLTRKQIAEKFGCAKITIDKKLRMCDIRRNK